MRPLPLFTLGSLVHAGLFTSDPQLSATDYTIDDILSRYRNLSSTQRSITFFQSHSEMDTSCVRQALDPILAQCLHSSINNLDQRQRAATAARLAVCEFEVAQVDYPAECRAKSGYFLGGDSGVDYMECIAALETRSQWWTSYSGYYRSIGEICLQESVPYEKEEIWGLFLGVTEHYEKVFDVLREYVDMSQRFKEESEREFESARGFMEEMRRGSQENKDKMDDMWRLVAQQMENLSQMSVKATELTRVQSDELETTIMTFFESVDTQFSQELESLKEQFITELEQRDALMSITLEHTREKLYSLHSITDLSHNLTTHLHSQLHDTSDTAARLNDSLTTMDTNVGSLTSEIQGASEMMSSLAGVLENNVLVRTLLFMSRDFAVGAEAVLVTGTLTVLTFVVCVLVSWRVNIFKYIGIFVVSGVLGSALGTVFMLVGRVVDEELARQMSNVTITNATL